jgi:hypothetical protein
VDGESRLFEVVCALHPPCGLPCGLHSRKKQGNQDADDGNDDKKFD